MAAPTPVTRLASTGTELVNGKRISIAIALDLDIDIFEEEITPPGLETEDAIDTTTQRNVRYMTYAPGDLIKLTEFDVLCGYDSHAYVSLLAIMGIATTLTIRFPNGAKLTFYGYVKTVKPSSMKRKEKPKMTITFMPTNLDPSDCSEQPPVYTAGSGTVGCA